MPKNVTVKTGLTGVLLAALIGLTGCGGGEPPELQMIQDIVKSRADELGPSRIALEGNRAEVIDFQVGEAFYSQSWSGVPDGTEVFPVRVNCHITWQEREIDIEEEGKSFKEIMEGRLVSHEWTGIVEFYFWKNSYGEWAYRTK